MLIFQFSWFIIDKSQPGKQQFDGTVKILEAGRAYDGTMS
ncbi:hypothetical protein CLOSCI_02854 [[Clostridium] scindens ATCC 35704]|nr:hypothetical protein CLOSCI_02854 [[Clostridium] scindens ATCC 35704]